MEAMVHKPSCVDCHLDDSGSTLDGEIDLCPVGTAVFLVEAPDADRARKRPGAVRTTSRKPPLCARMKQP